MEEKAEVAEVVAGGAGLDGVAEGGEEGVGVEIGQGDLRVQVLGMGADVGLPIGEGSGGWAVAVDAVGACTQDGDGVTGLVELGGAEEGELGVATTYAGR